MRHVASLAATTALVAVACLPAAAIGQPSAPAATASAAASAAAGDLEPAFPCGGAGQPVCGSQRLSAAGRIHAAAALASRLADCYSSNAVRLGAGNTEPGASIIQGARAVCRPVAESLYQAYTVAYVADLRAAASATVADQARAEDSAMLALLDARASGRTAAR